MATKIPRTRFWTYRLFWLALHLVLFFGMYMFLLRVGEYGNRLHTPHVEQILYLIWIWPTALVAVATNWLLPNWLAMILGFAVTMGWYNYLAYRRTYPLPSKKER